MKLFNYFLFVVLSLSTVHSEAADKIPRIYQSGRSVGMGGLILTTGKYQEVFFGNPARILANDKWRIEPFDLYFDTTPTTLSSLSDILGGDGEVFQKVASTTGKNLHARAQIFVPSIYIPKDDMSFAFSFFIGTQFDIKLRASNRIEAAAIVDIGPSLTYGHKFLGDSLWTGITSRFMYRLSTAEGYSFVDFVEGKSISPLQNGGEGAHLEFDLGATYTIPEIRPLGFTLKASAVMNNILGGKYKMFPMSLALKCQTSCPPVSQPRTVGLGVSAERESLWEFANAVFALEIQNLGNNDNSTLFRLLHFGGEVKHLDTLFYRLGFYQGYISAGIGIDIPVLRLDLATYGEELSLTAGGLQDRIISLHLGFKI